MTIQHTDQPTATATRCRCICPNGCDCGCTCLAAIELRAEQRARREANGGPIRIQRKRIPGWRKPDNCVIVSRPSRFANPFALAPAASQRGGLLDMWAVEYKGRKLGRWDDIADARAEAADRYARWIREPEQEPLRALARQLLYGRDLTCWCKTTEPCHADVLLEIANG
jgi:hypothetical protein